jgi:copper chaperone NosL
MNSISLSSGHLNWPLHFERTEMRNKMSKLSRWLVLLATLLLPIAYFTPIWKIQLWAPQYPEGLQMQIWIDKLSGDVNTINGLNHYIGMAFIEEEMFPELKFLKYIVGGIIAFGIITFLVNKPALLKIFTLLLVLFAVAAMADMYIWGYKYGHNLDPHAAIKIEGESYQPPLIGYKQLLNFLAFSFPDNGGIALFASGLIALFATVYHWLKNRKKKVAVSALGLLLLFGFISCKPEAPKLNFNKDDCDYCGMKLMDDRYGCLFVTPKGKAYRFDDINCMLNFYIENATITPEQQMVIDFSSPGKLIDATTAVYLKNEELKSPMGGNAAAFAVQDSANRYHGLLGGSIINWKKIQDNE